MSGLAGPDVGSGVILATVVAVAVLADSLLLASRDPSAHRLGFVLARERVSVPADARALDLSRVSTDAQAGGCELADGSVVVWHNPVRWGNHWWAASLPMGARVLGVNAISAMVRREGGVQETVVRARPTLAVLLAWCFAMVGYVLYLGMPAIGAAGFAVMAGLVGMGAWWAYQEVRTYISRVAPTS